MITSHKIFVAPWAVLYCALVLSACHDVDPPGPGAARSSLTGSQQDGAAAPAAPTITANTTGQQVSAPFDVGRVMRQVHYAFRPCKGGGCAFEAGHTTHGVQVDQNLRVKVTPAHHDAAAMARVADPQVGPRQPNPHDRPAAPPVRVGQAATFETVAILRGQHVLGGRGETRVADDGALVMTRGTLQERLVNSGQGVEQSWAMASRPAGSGDLVVKVKVSGLKYAGATAAGLHFADAASGLGLRYGHATFVDANRKRTAVRGLYAGGQIILRVPRAVIDGAAYPAVLDPVISAEVGLDKPVSGPAWGSQVRPRLAHDGTNYLVVWHDGRDSTASQTNIYGARVSTAGVVLDKTGILISGAVNNQHNPTVAFGGGTFMVTWRDYRNNTSYPDIYGARVKSDGTVMEPAGIAISVAASHQYEPYVVYGGGTFLVVWYDYRHSGYCDIYGARVKPDGTVQDPNGIAISKAKYYQQSPTAAYDGTNFFVVWQDYRHSTKWMDVYGSRVSPAGKVLDTSGIAINRSVYHQYNPHVAYIYNGSTYLVVWQDNRSYSNYNIYGARVSTAGVVQDKTGIAICTASGHQYSPVTAHDGTSFYVVWQDYRSSGTTKYDIYGTSVSTAGKVTSTSGKVVSAAAEHQQSPFLAHSGKDYLVVWSDARNGSTIGQDIYGALVSGGTVTTPSGILISAAANNQGTPAVAHDGTNYLVVWQDYRNYKSLGQDLYGALVSATGTVMTSSGIVVSTNAKDQVAPAAAFGGGRYMVVWQDSRSGTHIYGTQVDTTGKVLQPTGFPLTTASNSQTAPDVAHDGTNYLVVWQDYRNSTSYPDIYGALVNKYGGKTSSADIVISKASYHQQAPSVAFGGGTYMVVWEDNRNSSTTGYDIYGSRIKISGTVDDAKGIAISKLYQTQTRPDVAWDGTNFLAVWQDYRNYYSTSYDIYGARISSAGAVLDKLGIAVSVAGGNQEWPRVASGGVGSLVLWQDRRNTKYNSDVFGTLVSSGGVVKSPLGMAVAASTQQELAPDLAAGTGGRYLAAYSRFDPKTPAGSFRVFGRLITEEKQLGVSCTAGKQCSSGYCSDGVCCDKPCGLGNPTDCQACSVATGSSKDGTCEAAKSGTKCRSASDTCDKAETCDGSTMTCPADSFHTSTKVCRGALGPCDEAETCSGSSAACPTDQFKASGSVCRATLGSCDLAEICSGSSALCPQDTFMPGTKECRAASGTCDVAENCSGSSGVCPSDTFKASTTVCRAATGDCDQEEKCTGAAGVCPSDLNKVDGTACKTGKCKAGQCQTLPDQGVVDKGAPDMGVDKSVPDQLVPDQQAPDQQLPDKGPAPDQCLTQQCPDCEEGCSISGGGAGTGGWILMLLALLALRRRRR